MAPGPPTLAPEGQSAHTVTMPLKNAAFLALIGTRLLYDSGHRTVHTGRHLHVGKQQVNRGFVVLRYGASAHGT